MGTRNLTAVFFNGEYRVAQYGQWDGYPSGQGATILGFLNADGNIEKLKSQLGKVRFLDPQGIDKEFCEQYDKNTPEWSNEPDNRTTEQKRWFETYMTRDLGGKILFNIANSNDSEIVIKNNIDFAGDSLFCEWAYIIDFDAGTFEVFRGFNKDPLNESERFSKSPTDGKGYEPVKLVHSFQISELPSDEDFLKILEPPDDDE